MNITAYIYQFLESFSFFALSSLGMAIIYGMMGITNLAHGEFIMIGAYVTVLLSSKLGIPFCISVVLGAFIVALIGVILDRTIICRLYSRPLDSIVATWGISLIFSQTCFILFGPTMQGPSTPLGTITIGDRSYSIYRLLLVLISIVLLVLLYMLFNKTRFGLHSRATMQNREVASSLGVNSNKMNALTFMLGSGLAGLVGGLYSPLLSLTPSFGGNFLMQSFVTVIVGGANPLIGTILASLGLGTVESTMSSLFGTFYGRIGILVIAIIFIRILPGGFSGYVEAKALKRKER